MPLCADRAFTPTGVVKTPPLRAGALDGGSRISYADYTREASLGASSLAKASRVAC